MKEDAKLRRRFNYDNTYNFYKIMKEQQTDAGTNSWAIRWYWTNFKRDGYILSPLHSLVSNEGMGRKRRSLRREQGTGL